MTPSKTTSTPKQFTFKKEKLSPVVVNFQGGQVTSDAPSLFNCGNRSKVANNITVS
jgi:hypothetical protein